MSPSKRALLIASPYDGLKGPLEDVEATVIVLKTQGFNITKCCGVDAKRNRIIQSWRAIIHDAGPQDTVVVYYSGHGGLVEDDASAKGDHVLSSGGEGNPWRYQFIVPMDYGETTANDFRGILDVELAHLLRDTTKKTENVTIILDCCHSGRMARDPKHGDEAMPRFINKIQHHNITNHVKNLRETGELQGETDLLGNQSAVRIAAAAATEVAWSYRNANGEWRGAMTEALMFTITESTGHEISWRTTLLRVRELVNVEFSDQHPSVEGPDTRLLFSLSKVTPEGLLVKMEDGVVIIQAGRVSGVRVGNVYIIMPFGAEKPDGRWIGQATVTHVIGFKARSDVQWRSVEKEFPPEGALAFLKEEVQPKFPVTVPQELPILEDAVNRSTFLRRREDGDDTTPLAYLRREGQSLILTTNSGAEIASELGEDSVTATQTIRGIVGVAEQLAQAQHLLGLKCDNESEKLNHDLEITLGTVVKGKRSKILEQNGEGSVTEQDRLFISLQNAGHSTIYISVFDVNVIGKISLVSIASPKGIELPPGRECVLGNDEFGLGLKGLLTAWPNALSKRRSIDEHFVFILTDTPVGLLHLTESKIEAGYGRGALSDLERLIYRVVTGRDVHSESATAQILFDTVHIPFSLESLEYKEPGWSTSTTTDAEDVGAKTKFAKDLPSPESVLESEPISPSLPPPQKEQRVSNGRFQIV